MAKPPRAVTAKDVRGQGRDTARKLLYYKTLYHLNRGFNQVLSQLQQLEKGGVGRRAWKKLQVIVEEARAEINFELVYVLQERELRDWTYFGAVKPSAARRRREHEFF
jgi:hypothetical protein